MGVCTYWGKRDINPALPWTHSRDSETQSIQMSARPLGWTTCLSTWLWFLWNPAATSAPSPVCVARGDLDSQTRIACPLLGLQ